MRSLGANRIFSKPLHQAKLNKNSYRIIHTDKYFKNVADRLEMADILGGKQGVLDELNSLADDLLFNKQIW